jgi:hypothetical protein
MDRENIFFLSNTDLFRFIFEKQAKKNITKRAYGYFLLHNGYNKFIILFFKQKKTSNYSTHTFGTNQTQFISINKKEKSLCVLLLVLSIAHIK